jgi:hypothetical protein
VSRSLLLQQMKDNRKCLEEQGEGKAGREEGILPALKK